jgi:hypothetical protein
MLRELLARLHDAGVEFVIVGDVAARLNGSSLPTDDFDICCRMNDENMTRLSGLLAGIHPIVRGDPRELTPPLDPSVLKGVNMLMMRTDLGQFDLISEVVPIGRYEQVLARSVIMEVEGRPTRVLDLDALIAAKRAAGRTKDKLGLLYLEAAKKRRERRDPRNR